MLQYQPTETGKGLSHHPRRYSHPNPVNILKGCSKLLGVMLLVFCLGVDVGDGVAVTRDKGKENASAEDRIGGSVCTALLHLHSMETSKHR